MVLLKYVSRMRLFYFLFTAIFCLVSCVPISIAPDLENGKVIRAKKFKRKLPNRHSYVFTDPKNADEFYYFINTKFQRENEDVEYNVPVDIEGKRYYVSFYETEKSTQTINLLTIIVDRAIAGDDGEPYLEDIYTSRWGTWYVGLMIADEDFNDALNPEYVHYDQVSDYSENLKDEYLSMTNYNQSILQKAGQ